jgi:endonuclease/exonuclease/phosphatase family metal-dependent hydrolase
MSAIWGDNTFLFVFNTHLDPNNANNKREQLRQIHEFMWKSLQSQSSKSNFSSERCGLLLMGDFNIPSFWKEEYELMKQQLQMRDLYQEYLQETGGEEKATYSEENSYFTKLKYVKESRRIDYIFALDNLSLPATTSAAEGTIKTAKIPFMSLKASQWEIATQPTGKELSDHWAQLAWIQPKAK